MFFKKILIIFVLFICSTSLAGAEVNKIIEWKNGKEYPLGNALVIIGQNIWLDCKSSGTDIVKGDAVLDKVSTDSQGNFVTGLPAGTYDVIVWKKGYTPQVDTDIFIPGYSTGIAYDTSMQGRHRELTYEVNKNILGLDVTGTYKCRDGMMYLKQIGDKVSGNYDWAGGGVVSGTLKGNTLYGTFKDNICKGDIKYVFSSDGSEYEHIWRPAGESVWRSAGLSIKQ